MKRQSGIRISLVVVIAASAGFGFWTVPQAFAQGGACRDDVAKYCKDVQPGQGGIARCLKEHENDLSAGCKAQFAEMAKRRQEAREACEDDIARLCANEKPRGGRIYQCLKEHENELSPQCKAKMLERHQRSGQKR